MSDNAYEDILTRLGETSQNITFVCIGAADGKSFDPLHKYIKRYKWPGLLVEPLSDLFENLKQTYEGHDNLIFENCAVSEFSGIQALNRVPLDVVKQGLVPGWALGISSLYSDRNALGGKRVTDADFSSIQKYIVQEQVRCEPLAALVERHGLTSIDIVQIDTEGHDYKVLKQVDFERFRPAVVFVEYYNLPDDEKILMVELLERHGYLYEVIEADLLAYDISRIGSSQERDYISLYRAAKASEERSADEQEVIGAYIRACDALPTRAEAWHGASRYCRLKERFEEGFRYAQKGVAIAMPREGIFVEPWIYQYGLLDELSVNAYWSGHYDDGYKACNRILTSVDCPEHHRDRIAQNMRFCQEGIDEANARRALVGVVQPRSIDSLMASSVPDRHVSLSQIYQKSFRIVRAIHVVWVGDEALRPDGCIETWRRLNPDWEVRVWGNSDLADEKWVNAQHISEMIEREWCGVADMMRWEILLRHGGFAIDADSICVRPLENWLFEPDLFACWENEHGRPGLIANGYVYSLPNNPLICQIVRDINELPNVRAGRAWQVTGPQRLTDTIKKLSYTDITIYPSHYFMPEHLTGLTYKGSGPIFGRQFWGAARDAVYKNMDQILKEAT